MPNRPVRDQWEYPGKMERHFTIKPGQPIGMAFTFFIPFLNSLIRAKNRFVKNGISVGIFQPKYVNHLQRRSRIFRSKETETDLSIWIPTEILGIFCIMEHPWFLFSDVFVQNGLFSNLSTYLSRFRSQIVKLCWNTLHISLVVCKRASILRFDISIFFFLLSQVFNTCN